MQSNAYQLLALGARALFIFAAALIVLRAALNLLRMHHARKKLLRRLPDAGMVGEMRETDTDKGYPLPREGVLGGGRGCDIRLKGLRRRQVSFVFVEGRGVLLTPCHRRTDTLLDGEPLHRGAYALHGALLRVGGYTLRIRLFAGLNVPHPAPYQEQRWQPAPEEDLYAPDDALLCPQAPAYAPWSAQPPQAAWPQQAPEEAAPPFRYAAQEAAYAPPPAPLQPPAEADPFPYAAPPQPFEEGQSFAPAPEEEPPLFEAPVRRRRTDRRETL